MTDKYVENIETKERFLFMGVDDDIKEGHPSPTVVLYKNIGETGDRYMQVDIDEFDKDFEFVKWKGF